MTKYFSYWLVIGLIVVGVSYVHGQTLYAPGGTIGTSSNSNVGIGTSAPVSFGSDYQILDLYKNGTFAVFLARTPSVAFEIQTVDWGLGIIGMRTAHPLLFRIAEVEHMRIDAAGRIGIGTSSPTHKLSVNGTIRAKEIIVDTGWADYVFADDYRLAPLAEVEAHIKKHRHLPGIPSAAEVAVQGVSLGEMQSRILAKVEELTLHVIELKKENQALRRELETLNPEDSAR